MEPAGRLRSMPGRRSGRRVSRVRRLGATDLPSRRCRRCDAVFLPVACSDAEILRAGCESTFDRCSVVAEHRTGRVQPMRTAADDLAADAADALLDVLRETGVARQRQSEVGGTPDLVVTRPDGSRLVFEVKAGAVPTPAQARRMTNAGTSGHADLGVFVGDELSPAVGARWKSGGGAGSTAGE